jgi:FkbM family methyltransferase
MLINRYIALMPSLLNAMSSDRVDVGPLRLWIPGSRVIRASVLMGNVRLRAIIDAVVRPGDTVVDVGANIGAIAAYAATRVGPSGRVLAIEPADDNLAVLRENLQVNHLDQVTVIAGAAGRGRESREFYLRGDLSAVNSLFPESCYAEVTQVSRVEVMPLDAVIEGPVALVKIDVEGAELDVLAGMPRLLRQPGLRLVIEWHPRLQQAAGYEPDALPRALLAEGFTLEAAGHLRTSRLAAHHLPEATARLMRSGHPVELLCTKR